MSLLVKEVEQRWQHKFELLQHECDGKVRAADARSRVAEAELAAGLQRAEDHTNRALKDNEKRLEQAAERERIAEERAAQAFHKAQLSAKRAEERVQQEREAGQARILELEREVERIGKDADARVAEMSTRLQEALRRAERAELDAEARVKQAQAAAEKEIAECKVRERRAIDSARNSCQAQSTGVTDRALRIQHQCHARAEQAQTHAVERVDLASRRALAAHRRIRGHPVEGDRCYGHRCGDPHCGAGPLPALVPAASVS